MSLEQWNRLKERRTSNLTFFKVESIDFQTTHLGQMSNHVENTQSMIPIRF